MILIVIYEIKYVTKCMMSLVLCMPLMQQVSNELMFNMIYSHTTVLI